MNSRIPKTIPFDNLIWPICDNPLRMERRLDFADWLSRNGQRERSHWIRACCGDCQYVRELVASFSHTERSTQFCYSDNPLERATKALVELRPKWWRTPPEKTGCEMVHFGRIIVSEYGDPKWIFSDDWIEEAWRSGWLEILHLVPNDMEQLKGIVDTPDPYRFVPFLLDAVSVHDSQSSSAVVWL